jgi:hypothetical protein
MPPLISGPKSHNGQQLSSATAMASNIEIDICTSVLFSKLGTHPLRWQDGVATQAGGLGPAHRPGPDVLLGSGLEDLEVNEGNTALHLDDLRP